MDNYIINNSTLNNILVQCSIIYAQQFEANVLMSLNTGPSENEFRALVSLFHQNEYKQAFTDTNSLIDKHPNCAELF